MELSFKNEGETSRKDGVIGRYASLPCTTQRRITTNSKTKNNQKCQKIELYGSLTTKELKKKQSSNRRVGDRNSGQRGLIARQQLVD